MSQFIQVLAAVILSLNHADANVPQPQQPDASEYTVLVHRRSLDEGSAPLVNLHNPRNPDDHTARLVLEEIEDSIAILETAEGRIYIPKDLLPPGTHEGNVLKLSILQDETDLRLAEARSRIERMQRMSR